MIRDFAFPPTGFGPGSQPGAEDDELAYMALPSGMRAYAPHVPDVTSAAALSPVLAFLDALADACDAQAAGAPPGPGFVLTALEPAARKIVADALGSGEVSLRAGSMAAQESVFAGVWVVTGDGPDRVEIGAVPPALGARAFTAEKPPAATIGAALPEGVFNAPPILTELREKAAAWRAGDPPHVVNLTLLPHTPEDLDWLDAALGQGSARFLSRGYGNCTVTATATAPVWRVRFYNSTDQLILDTFEVTAMPEVVLAASEDLADSARRLREIREAIA